MDRREIDTINRAEELLLQARGVAEKIQLRVWLLMKKHGLPLRHTPGQTVVGRDGASRRAP